MVRQAVTPTSVEVALSGRLASLARDPAASALVKESLDNELAVMTGELGLSGAIQTTVRGSRARRPLRVLVNGSSIPFPPDMLWALVAERRGPGGIGANGFDATIVGDAVSAHCGPDRCDPEEIGSLVAAMIRDRPSILVDDAQATSFAMAARERRINGPALKRVLVSLLDLGLAPISPDLVVDVLRANDGCVPDAIEAAFASLGGGRVGVAVSPRYHRVLTKDGSSERLVADSVDDSAKWLFQLLEERLLVEWGVLPPDIVWAESEDVPDGRLVVEVNNRRSVSVQGLESDERLVLGGEEVDGVRVRRKILNPANIWFDLAVVSAADAEKLPKSEVLPPVGFTALVTYREIVANAHRLLGNDHTLYLLQDLAPRAPELVDVVMSHFTVAELTQMLRGLVRERLPPRLLPVMLERLARLVIHDNLQPDRVEFVRRGLSKYMLDRFVLGELNRSLYALSPDLEATISRPQRNAEPFAESVRDAVWSTLRAAGDVPGRAAVVVRKGRRDVYRLLSPELPEIVVIRQSDLGPDTQDLRAVITVPTTR